MSDSLFLPEYDDVTGDELDGNFTSGAVIQGRVFSGWQAIDEYTGTIKDEQERLDFSIAAMRYCANDVERTGEFSELNYQIMGNVLKRGDWKKHFPTQKKFLELFGVDYETKSETYAETRDRKSKAYTRITDQLVSGRGKAFVVYVRSIPSLNADAYLQHLTQICEETNNAEVIIHLLNTALVRRLQSGNRNSQLPTTIDMKTMKKWVVDEKTSLDTSNYPTDREISDVGLEPGPLGQLMLISGREVVMLHFEDEEEAAPKDIVDGDGAGKKTQTISQGAKAVEGSLALRDESDDSAMNIDPYGAHDVMEADRHFFKLEEQQLLFEDFGVDCPFDESCEEACGCSNRSRRFHVYAWHPELLTSEPVLKALMCPEKESKYDLEGDTVYCPFSPACSRPCGASKQSRRNHGYTWH